MSEGRENPSSNHSDWQVWLATFGLAIELLGLTSLNFSHLWPFAWVGIAVAISLAGGFIISVAALLWKRSKLAKWGVFFGCWGILYVPTIVVGFRLSNSRQLPHQDVDRSQENGLQHDELLVLPNGNDGTSTPNDR